MPARMLVRTRSGMPARPISSPATSPSRKSATTWGIGVPPPLAPMPRSTWRGCETSPVSTSGSYYETRSRHPRLYRPQTSHGVPFPHGGGHPQGLLSGCRRHLHRRGARGARRCVSRRAGTRHPLLASQGQRLAGLVSFCYGTGLCGLPPLPPTPPTPQSVFTPYIYAPEELQRLLQGAAAGASPWATLSATTVRTLLLLLYGAALRISEALALTLADVDMAASLLTIRTSKFYKTRWVPIGPRLCATLAAYSCERPPSLLLQTPDAPFFLTRRGAPVTRQQAERAFRRVCTQAEVCRNDNTRYQPRLHDLHHTSAVHRL